MSFFIRRYCVSYDYFIELFSYSFGCNIP